jgi:hypothetical protein
LSQTTKKIRRLKYLLNQYAKPEKPSVAELKKLTKNQLIELAEKKNLKVKKSGAKAAVISEIRDQLK